MLKRRLAKAIVRLRAWILVALTALACWSATMIGATNVNYDLNQYLSPDTMTKRALTVMQEEFGSSEQVRVMFCDLDDAGLDGVLAALDALPETRVVAHDPDEGVRERDGHTYDLVTVTLGDCDASAFVTDLRSMFPEAGDYYVGGTAASQLDIQKNVAEEMPAVMGISLLVVLGVLLLTSHAWLEPAVILFVLAVSILINMGTNFVFPSVSFITFAVCAVLQLALSIDYAIMLLRAYDALRTEGLGAEEAMEGALVESFMRISSSALTTVAGLLSLLFMSFTIGFDIGLVLSKGIVISMLCVFLLMPAVALLLEKPLMATRHKPLRLGADRLASGIYRAKAPVAATLILVVLAGAWLASQNTYTFTNSDEAEKSEAAVINEVFGATNPLVLLVPAGDEDADYDRQRALVDDLQALVRDDGSPVVDEVQAMVTTGAAALDYYTAADVAEMTGMNKMAVGLFFKMQGFGESVRADRLLESAEGIEDDETLEELRSTLDTAKAAFIGPHYTRILLDLGFGTSDPGFIAYMDQILSATGDAYGQDFYVTGTPMSAYDIAQAFQGDLLRVNAITFLAILAIVALSFRAIALPLLLVFVIEGAIFVNMGVSRLIGQPVFFISYLICVSIQMGATIDYGILLSDRHRRLREAGTPLRDSLAAALETSMPTILTSGIILTTAGYIVGRMCSVYYISSIGLLISRGAFVSVVLVLLLLPALLALCDRVVVRKRAAKTAE